MFLFLAAAAVGIVLPALHGPLLFDDLSSVTTAARHGATALGELFRLQGAGEAGYRPLRYLSLWIDWRLGGGDPLWLHLSSALWHAGCALLLWFLLLRLTRDRRLALLAALLFIVHPLQVEAVAYISGRKDLLCTFFSLLALHASLGAGRAVRPAARLGLSALFFLCWWLAMQAKEMAAVVPLAALLLEAADRPPVEPAWRLPAVVVRRRPVFAGVLGAGVLLAAWKVLVLAPGTKVPVERWGDLPERLWLAARTLSWHVRKLLWPWPQVGDLRGLFPVRVPGPDGVGGGWGAWWNGGTATATLAGLVLLALLALLVRRAAPGRRRWATVGLAGWLLLLLPVLNLVPLNEPAAEHYQHLPLAAGGLLAAALLLPPAGAPRRRWWPALVLLLAWTGASVHRAAVWSDPARFWTDVLRVNPGDGRAWNDLGLVLAERGDAGQARRCYARAWRCDPGLVQAAANLVAARLAAGDPSGALAVGEQALARHPDDPLLLSLQGRALLRSGRPAAAASLLDRLASLRPREESRPVDGWRGDRALAHQLAGDLSGSLALYREALAVTPDDPVLLTNAGGALLDAGHLDEALPLLLRAVRLPDAGGMAHRNLAVALLKAGRPSAARWHLERAGALGTKVPPSLAQAVARAVADSTAGR